MVKALGLIETIGLPAAIAAADAAVKAAQVALSGLEFTRGGGMIVVMFTGDVGAVQAAVKAGEEAALKTGKVWAVKVIPRPHPETSEIIHPEGLKSLEHKNSNGQELCNICQDPCCNRKKGEPRVYCLHYVDKETET